MRSLKTRSGRYGKAKFAAFSSLENRGWVQSRELVLLAGLPYGSITKLLTRWTGWEYVERRMAYKFGAGTYEYKITNRGRGWLAAARRDLPMASKFNQDLKSWQKSIRPKLPALMEGKFSIVVNTVNNHR